MKEKRSKILSSMKETKVRTDGLTVGRVGFYADPYITCFHCNFILFLDINQFDYLQCLRHLHVGDVPIPIPNELRDRLPPCPRCGGLNDFVVGAFDFSQDIANYRQWQQEQRRLQVAAAKKIAICYRRYLKRCYALAKQQAKTSLRYLRDQAATVIAALARGRLARRRFVTEKHLAFIKESHPLLIRHALKIFPGQQKVFWYRRQVELDLLYADYLLLIEKTGHQPPRIMVERNIALMAERILKRQHELATLLQKRWRGFVSRRIVRLFRSEIARIFSREVGRAMMIQRAYRGHYVRMFILPKLLADHLHNFLMSSYQKEQEKKLLQAKRQKKKEKLQSAYIKELKNMKTSRYLQKIAYVYDEEVPNPGLRPLINTPSALLYDTKTRPLVAGRGDEARIHKTAFGDEKVLVDGLQVFSADLSLSLLGYKNAENDNHRRDFIIQRVGEVGPLGYGSRSKVPPPTLDRKGIRESSRSASMRQYFATNLEDIKDRAVQKILNPAVEDCFHQRARKEKAKQVVHQQLRMFNEEKDKDIQAVRSHKHAALRRSSQFRFPDEIGFDATQWLYEHDENI
eukprot:gene9145-10095_t